MNGPMARIALTISLMLGAAGAMAQTAATPDRTPSSAQTAQQERMRSCNATAGTRSLTGDARRSFMADCLAGRGTAEGGARPTPPQAAQQERMRTCNATATTRNLSGDARRNFMSSCLSGR